MMGDLGNSKEKRKAKSESNVVEWFLAVDIDANGKTV